MSGEVSRGGAENAEKIELLPCPFCGGSVQLAQNQLTDESGQERPFFEIACEAGHGMILTVAETKSEAVQDWNTRADRWISVNESLPDGPSTVLVFCPRDPTTPVWLGYFDGSSWASPDNVAMTGPVTHWMDLPKAPDLRRDTEQNTRDACAPQGKTKEGEQAQ